MCEIEKMLRIAIKSFQNNAKSAERLYKISNSFCCLDEQPLLQPKTNQLLLKKEVPKPTMGKKQLCSVNNPNIEMMMMGDKENESLISNGPQLLTGSIEDPRCMNLKQSLKGQLLNLKRMIQDFKHLNIEEQEVGGSMFYDPNSLLQDSMHNLLSHLLQQQQSDLVVKPESSQASVNQAFIQNSDVISRGKKNRDTTLDMSFNQNEILVVDGKSPGDAGGGVD